MTAPATPVQVLITFNPVDLGLPDAEANVLLLLSDGSTCEGFYDGTEDDGRVVWRDVTADELDDGAVRAWADMPEGLNDPQRVRRSLQAAWLNHNGDCVTDPHARAVCEGMYIEKCDDVLSLVDALNAVYSLAGESAEVARITQAAIRKHGGPAA
jgi:hypothetical protein